MEDPPEYVDCGPHTVVAGLCVDSRALRPGEAFLAVRGGTHDGHAFVEAALRSGAAAVVETHASQTIAAAGRSEAVVCFMV